MFLLNVWRFWHRSNIRHISLDTYEPSESQTGGEGEKLSARRLHEINILGTGNEQGKSRLILGYTGSQPQKGVASYALSANRQRPLAGALNAAIFNTWRRFRGQVLYVAPPFIIAYTAMEWAIERFVLLMVIQPRTMF